MKLVQRWCVVVSYWDNSGVMAVYGPMETQEEAKDFAQSVVGNFQITGKAEPRPIVGIE